MGSCCDVAPKQIHQTPHQMNTNRSYQQNPKQSVVPVQNPMTNRTDNQKIKRMDQSKFMTFELPEHTATKETLPNKQTIQTDTIESKSPKFTILFQDKQPPQPALHIKKKITIKRQHLKQIVNYQKQIETILKQYLLKIDNYPRLKMTIDYFKIDAKTHALIFILDQPNSIKDFDTFSNRLISDLTSIIKQEISTFKTDLIDNRLSTMPPLQFLETIEIIKIAFQAIDRNLAQLQKDKYWDQRISALAKLFA